MNEQTAPDVIGVNKQKPLPSREFDGTYLVHSMFFTLQGEGPFSGDPAVFIRLEGCNLQCPFCDTDYTGGPRAVQMTALEIKRKVDELVGDSPVKLVVITGGEPFRQDLTRLVTNLRLNKYRVQIETNGTLAPSDRFKEYCLVNPGVAIVVSPKANYVDAWIRNNAIAFKYVLSADSIDANDGLPLIVLGRKSNPVARPPAYALHVYVSPADMGDDTVATQLNVQATIKSAMTYGYRLQLQIHKYLGVE